MKNDYREASPEFRVRADAFSEKLIMWALLSTIIFLGVVIVKEIYWRSDSNADGRNQTSPNDKRLDHYSTKNPYDPYASQSGKKDPYADSAAASRQRPL
ncbi:MAG: hypothetical protein ABI771_17300 [Betaproteobacteria bacterium]